MTGWVWLGATVLSLLILSASIWLLARSLIRISRRLDAFGRALGEFNLRALQRETKGTPPHEG